MTSCIFLLYLTVLAAPAAAQPTADDLYARRADPASARKAADAWRAQLASDPKAFDAAWKLSQAEYWLGEHTPQDEARKHFEAGIDAGQKAAAIAPDRPEGHFWIAANMGRLAESFGIRAGLKYRKPIKQELETVLRIDAGYRQGSADRALGRWYDKVPRLFGGNTKLAEEHLKKALTYNPNSTITHFFLAELYIDEDRNAEARTELQKVIDAPLDPNYEPEDRDYKQKATQMLKTVR